MEASEVSEGHDLRDRRVLSGSRQGWGLGGVLAKTEGPSADDLETSWEFRSPPAGEAFQPAAHQLTHR